MLEGLTEEQAKKQILEMVGEYARSYHKKKNQFQKGDRISYAARVYDQDEMINLVDSSLDFWLTSGKYTEQFEKQFAKYLGVPYCSTVNSGSSANLLAFMALTSPLIPEEKRVFPGDEIITVACGFPTTVSPIIQFGAIPVFLDMVLPEYNIDTTQLQEALSNKTKAVMVAHTLGNPFNLTVIKQFCDANNLWLIEDNCDALGSQYKWNDSIKFTGTIGDIGTSSFYPPHHMTMGEGGALYTSNPLLHKIIRSLRDWGRDCVCPSGKDNLCGHRFDRQYGELPLGYDHKYVYSHFGYNLKITDMQAAIGCAQLKKLPSFVEKRKENWSYLRNSLEDMKDFFILPEATLNSEPSWFGFLLTCQPNVERKKIVQVLESNNIQTRTLFAGNLIKHPCFDEMRRAKKGYRTIGDLDVTNRIMEDSFWVGVYPGMQKDELEYMVQIIKSTVK